MSEKVQLQLKKRAPGKKLARELRKKKCIPIVIYGNNKENEYAYAEDLNFRKSVFPNSNALFELKTESGMVSALARNIDYDTLNNTIIHADFYAIDVNTEIVVNVSVEFEGEPKGFKSGGVLNKILEEVEVECMPSDIPNSLVIDISELDIDEKLHVSDLKLPAKVKLITDPEEVLVAVYEKTEEPEAPVSAEGAAPEAAAPASEAAGEADSAEKSEN